MASFEGFAELVFGFVYPAGAKADLVTSLLTNYLKQYNYSTDEFRVSQRLRSLELGISFEKLSSYDLMNALMTAGNRARELSALPLNTAKSPSLYLFNDGPS